MTSRSDLESKSRLVLGLGLLSLVAILLLRMLLPVVVITIPIVGMSIGGFWIWKQWQQHQQRQKRQQARLDARFYELLRQRQGRISILDFAMATQLNGTEAQAYLNTQAQAFAAYCETIGQGDIVYVFNTAARAQAKAQAKAIEAGRAYAHMARVEKAYAARANAKQLRTLRQLSQQNLQKEVAGLKPCPSIHVEVTEENSSKRSLPPTLQPTAHAAAHKAISAPDPEHSSDNAKPEPALPDMSRQSPIMRGRAHSAPDRVVTIDVPAVSSS